MYCLTPSGQILSDNSPFHAQDLIRPDDFLPGKTNDDIPWQWATSDEFKSTDFPMLLGIALRFGEPIHSGLLLDDRHVCEYYRLKEIDHYRKLPRPESVIAASKSVDRLFPGHDDARQKLDAEVKESLDSQYEELKAELDKTLSDNPVELRLQQHWEKIGGLSL